MINRQTPLNLQIDRYLELGFAEELGQREYDFFQSFDPVRALFEAKDLSILAVIPETMVGLTRQLELTGNRMYLDPNELHHRTPLEVEPTLPYLLTNMSYGKGERNLSGKEVRDKFQMLGRSGLRLNEVIAIGAQRREEFDHRYGTRGLLAVETVHINGATGEKAIVDLYQYGDGEGSMLKVKRDPEEINDSQWTAPSYRQRLIGS